MRHDAWIATVKNKGSCWLSLVLHSVVLDRTEAFILHLATERGLSTRYQLLVRSVLETFASWAKENAEAHPCRRGHHPAHHRLSRFAKEIRARDFECSHRADRAADLLPLAERAEDARGRSSGADPVAATRAASAGHDERERGAHAARIDKRHRLRWIDEIARFSSCSMRAVCVCPSW